MLRSTCFRHCSAPSSSVAIKSLPAWTLQYPSIILASKDREISKPLNIGTNFVSSIHTSRITRPPSFRVNPRQIQDARRRKLEREQESRQKLASVLNLSQAASQTPQIKSVEDLKKILPNLPYDERVKITSLINEYGDKLNECFTNITEISNEDEIALNKKENKSPPISEYQAAVNIIDEMVEEIIELEESGSPTPELVYKKLWKNVHIFSKMVRGSNDEPPLELLVVLFQIAKNQAIAKVRTRSIREVGDILYKLQLVRLDPYNEVDYLNSLVSSRRVNDALKIWKSRRSKKDVENSIWWLEVGTCLFQEANDFSSAEELASELIQKHDYVPPKVISRFIKCYTDMSKLEDAWRWSEYLVSQVKKAGKFGEVVELSGNLEPEDAEIMFNQKTIPTENDVIDALDMIVRIPNTNYSLKMIEAAKSVGADIPTYTLLKTIRTISRNISFLDTESALKTLANLRRSQGNPDSVLIVGDNIIDQVAYMLLYDNPELQTSKTFYQEWIYGLVSLGKIDRLYEVLKDMNEKKVQPTQLAAQYIMKILLSNNLLPVALELLDRMENADKQANNESRLPVPSPIHYSIFIQYAARRRNSPLIIDILERIRIAGIRYEESIYLALFNYFYRTKQFSEFLKLLSIPISDKYQHFTSVGYGTIWRVLRDYFMSNPKDIANFTTLPPIRFDDENPIINLAVQTNYNPNQAISAELGLKTLVMKMLQSGTFVPSLQVYESVLQTFLITGNNVAFFALLEFISKHNKIQFDTVFALKLTKLAEKMGKISQGDSHLIRTQVSSLVLSATSVQSKAINNIIQSRTSQNKLECVPFDALKNSTSLALNFNYQHHRDQIEELMAEFTTPL